MVKLEEVVDEEFERNLDHETEQWDTDIESVSSEGDDDDYMSDETVLDRIYALRDMVSPIQRKRIADTVSSASSWTKWGADASGNAMWIFVSSVLFFGAPMVVAYAGAAAASMGSPDQFATDALMSPAADEQKDGAKASL